MAYSYSDGMALPLGASLQENGVNFSVFSQSAESIELCLFDESGNVEIQRIPLNKHENYLWCAQVHGLELGAKYGYRASGIFDPARGLYFNPNKVMIDPYARQLDRQFAWPEAAHTNEKTELPNKDELAHQDTPANKNQIDKLDNVKTVPKAVVMPKKSAAEITEIQSRKPRTAWQKTILYEMHVRGFTKLHHAIPDEIRGTYSAVAHEATIGYLKDLGVTAIELLPVHAFIDEAFLANQGLSNFWGYNTLSFFAPHLGYSCTGQPDEFLSMVERLHHEGIEVILDVVYNHTAESNSDGPSLSFRGLDNPSYYRLSDENSEFINDTGCGNTVQADHPRVLQLILDSLRFWAGEMGVDGFRFDLAPILGRTPDGFDARCAFFQAISQDPLLSTCKLIAEPWDIGPGGYQLGAFPGEWSEWNDKYRDTCRRFWRGDKGLLPEFARRIHGSSDLFEHNGRGARASVNFVTSHDGFTLADLVSYKERHNEANNENNADGHHANFSENYGVEGETSNPEIIRLRLRQQRNMIATLFLSQGTPMLLAGDEFGKSQGGNNNAYCQDNEINWMDWRKLEQNKSTLFDFARHAIDLRGQLREFFPEKYIHNHLVDENNLSVVWLNQNGQPMRESDWHKADSSFIAWLLIKQENKKSKKVIFLFNANLDDVSFDFSKYEASSEWHCLLDSAISSGRRASSKIDSTGVLIESRSVMVLGSGF